MTALAQLPVDAPTRSADEDTGLRSVSIAVSVLDCFGARQELGATQVARHLGVAKSTASRMLNALAAGGLLERGEGGRFRLSMRMFEYGHLAVERHPLRAVARPVLMGLQTDVKEMVQLGIPVGGHVLYVDRFSTALLGQRLSGDVLRRVPGYSSSAGRSMAAYDPDVAAAMREVPRVRHTPFTVVDDGRLEAVLAKVRKAGFACSRDEYELGYSSIAAPVLVPTEDGTRAVAAVSAVGPTAHVLGVRREFLARSVRRAAQQIARGVLASGAM